MLELKDIVKTYGEGENMVTALQGVSMSFRESEFAAILGHSGCGKTTLLNIIGGLDHYTSGDLVINGVSTKKYKDKDWDSYRNHSIGFIFQSYNLIPHQNVLSNVELALTVSGVSKAERRRRAVEALEKVGLGDQLYKRPNQMSGGQMQRVAIARALVNDPDILLADEPTGALDTENSIQIMEILKEIARTKLVIMVTHNPELAKDYATRIIRISDGKLTSDSDPYTPEKEQAAEKPKKNVSMSFFTAIALSLNNLMTKKGRTFLTAFAGSIGIIGIALILSLSTGINDYINQIQQETLSSYPITINSETTDTSELMAAFLTEEEKNEQSTQQKMFSNTSSMEMFNSYNSSATRKNNLKDFKTFLDTDKGVQDNVTAIKYYYDTGMNLYTEDTEGRVIKCDITDIYAKAWGVNMSSSMSMMTGSISSFGDFQLFTQLISNADGSLSDIEKNRYELVYGSWPEKADEVVLILSQNNEIPDLVLYSLGYKDSTKAAEVLSDIVKGNIVEDYGRTEWTYEEAVGKTFKAVLPFEKYSKGSNGNYVDLTATDEGLDFLYNSDDVGTTLHISGIIRPLDGQSGMSSAYLAYSYALTEEMMDKLSDSELVKAAEESRDKNIISGLPFYTDDYTEPDNAEKAQRLKEYLDTADEEHRAEIFRFLVTEAEAAEETDIEEEPVVFTREEMEAAMIAAYSEQSGMDADTVAGYIKAMDDETLMQYFDEMAVQADVPVADEDVDEIPDDVMAAYDANDFTDDELAAAFDLFTPVEFSDESYEDVLKTLGDIDPEEPTTIMIYSMTFEKKDKIADQIQQYNDSAEEDDQIRYTDYVALLMSSITDIISGISYLLIAFVGISLVVSSIMIGIITYISVLERTREIGILRAIGASKRDISNVFNAETLIVGFISGLIGIFVSFVAIFPINALLLKYTHIEDLKAVLPWGAALILVLISMGLTLIAGLIPSGVAAKKDPVEALRTE
ncbi:MAG: ABC transporter ATP-binding protein/permease [Oscillospiraceae bacterium]|nr:ABC transporter ATP-binding protein/permease [Oscillospiraceae bacterium]